MPVRMLITDVAWAELEPRLAAIKPKAGSPLVLSDRLFIEAVLDLVRAGSAAGVWPLGCGVEPRQPLGRSGYLATAGGTSPT